MIDVEVVANLVAEAATIEIMPRWRNLAAGDIETKSGPNDVVTIADRRAEIYLTCRLAELLPGSRVVGEEAMHSDPHLIEAFASDDPVWVIDPIDGTSAFVNGSDQFAVMVALVQSGRLMAGWIHAPALGVMHYGIRGGGVMRSSREGRTRLAPPMFPDSRGGLVGLLGRMAMSEERRNVIKGRAGAFRELKNVSCAGIDYPRLLSGEAHFAVYNKSEPWDHLPGLLLATELGFVFAKHDGSAYEPGDNTGGLIVAPSRDRLDDIRGLLLG